MSETEINSIEDVGENIHKAKLLQPMYSLRRRLKNVEPFLFHVQSWSVNVLKELQNFFRCNHGLLAYYFFTTLPNFAQFA